MIRLKVKEIAASKGISQRKLSIRSEVDIKTIQKIYRYPTSIVTTETLDKIAKVLEVDAAELIESIADINTEAKDT
ncbi:MAG: helix-turn-helix transcriptional regulator [Ktedonobacteraceae bacterium]|nr:helix-turn-helix transcriptional regulator [Ktedonobacteraceae bacterium]